MINLKRHNGHRGGLVLTVALVVVAAIALLPATAPAQDRDCGDFATQAEAQDYFISLGGPAQDPDRLDGDRDGIACESLPCPCNSTGSPSNGSSPPEQAPSPTPTPPPTPGATAIRKAAQIVRVIDGDTLKVRLASRRRLTVRLIGIDTPESKRPGVAIECGSTQASAYMRRIAFDRGRGRRVTLISDPSQDQTDLYGRSLAYVDARGKGDLGRLMLLAGWAKVYVFERPFARLDRYRDAATAAESKPAGVWDRCDGDFHRSS